MIEHTHNTITITADTSVFRGVRAPIFRQYPGLNAPQRAFIELDEEGYVSASYDANAGPGVPAGVWHGRTLRFPIPGNISGDALADILESADVRALLQRIHDGHSVVWNGQNHVGRLNDDALDAESSLMRLLANDAERQNRQPATANA